MPAKRYQVFISSTSKDLKEIRREVQQVLYSPRYIPVGMECFGARNATVWETIREQIDCSDLLILIIAGRYGSIDDNSKEKWSYTEKEYDYAQKRNIPTLVFIRDPKKISITDFDEEKEKREKLERFKEKVKKHHIAYWQEADDLKTQVLQSIANVNDFAGEWIHFKGKEEWVYSKKVKKDNLSSIQNPLTKTIVEYGMVNIKVKGTVEECENGSATVTYLGSSLVDSPYKPVTYQDRVVATSGIISQKFTPEAIVFNEDQFKRNPTYLEYEIVATDAESKLSFTGEIVVHQRLQKKKGGIGLHIPYNAQYLIVNINIAEAPFIRDYNGAAKLIDRNDVKIINATFNESSKTYTITLNNAPANSNIAFEWENG